MYSGKVLDISWERVFVTISGEMREITDKDEKRSLLLERYKGLNAQRNNWRALSAPDFPDELLEGSFTRNADELKRIVGDSYDPEKIYLFLSLHTLNQNTQFHLAYHPYGIFQYDPAFISFAGLPEYGFIDLYKVIIKREYALNI